MAEFNNKAIIPLYVNDNLLNNLFTVVVQEYVQIKTISSRCQQVVKISTPLANIIKGQYIQGNFTIEILDEFTKQRTEEKISKNIVVLLETRGILESNNLLKKISTTQDLDNLQENDYVEFKAALNKSPEMEHMENMIRYLEMKNIFSGSDTNNNQQVLSVMKNYFEDWKSSRCLKFVSDSLAGSNTRAVVPVQARYMQDSLDYLYNNNVTIMGKVVKRNKNDIHNVDLSSGTYYDFLDEHHFKNFREKFLKDAPINGSYKSQYMNDETSLMEVLPIAMYI